METGLLFNGGPPVTMGPLGTNGKLRHHKTDVMKTIQLLPKSKHSYCTNTKENPVSLTTVPSFMDSSGNLLNLRKIERKTKSTKILVNPVCLDSVSSSDDSHRSKSGITKWNGKKKRLKAIKDYKKDENIRNNSEKDDTKSKDKDETKKDKKTISCFKSKTSDDKSQDETGMEYYVAKNASCDINVNEPDVINHTRKPPIEQKQLDIKETDGEAENKQEKFSSALVFQYCITRTLTAAVLYPINIT
ncbi:hypothetical protein RR48_14271 [Papilio machaon]|uniref:Uncharacterized protein n=1 Tax=Papilio machaon TaxID=76193 RepID=A0A194QLX8_PAPMA|nr:hypothetical protein RR48_14271 [Papilio machaon]